MSFKVYTGRIPGKTCKTVYEGMNTILARLPNLPRYVIMTTEEMYNQMKKLPEAYFRGRWLYLNYKNHTFFVKKFEIPQLPTGDFKTVKIDRVNIDKPIGSELLKKLVKETPNTDKGKDELLVNNIKWEPFTLKQENGKPFKLKKGKK